MLPAKTILRWGCGCLMLALAGALTGCWAAAAYEQMNGKAVDAQYKGLDEKSVAIVVYADPATTLEYPNSRDEISAFVTEKLQVGMPKVRLLNYKEVIRWQDDTLNWSAVPEKDIAKHFSVDRVIYIELAEYSTREPGSEDLLRGRIKALCKVFEADTPGDTPAWKNDFAVFWPEFMPQDVQHSSDRIVRKRVLDVFAEKLVWCFYDHKELEKTVREKSE